MELHRKDLNPETDSKRALELAAYFTHCQLQSAHLQLSLRSAMIAAYKLKNFSTTIVFARRLLELGPSSQSAAMVKLINRLFIFFYRPSLGQKIINCCGKNADR